MLKFHPLNPKRKQYQLTGCSNLCFRCGNGRTTEAGDECDGPQLLLCRRRGCRGSGGVAVQELGGNSAGSVCSTCCIHPVLLVGRHACSLRTACDVSDRSCKYFDTVSLGECLPTFRRIVMPSPTEVGSKESVLLRLFAAEGEGSTIRRNFGNHWPSDSVSHHRRHESSATPFWQTYLSQMLAVFVYRRRDVQYWGRSITSGCLRIGCQRDSKWQRVEENCILRRGFMICTVHGMFWASSN